MKQIIISLIRTYQKILSPDQGLVRDAGLTNAPRCAFYPTCSEYSILVVEKHGVVRGIFLSVRRLSRCHPWQKEHFDPVK